MDATQTRTVAEVMGWERPHLWIYDHEYCTYSCHWCSGESTVEEGFEPGDPVGCSGGFPCSDDPIPQPTVDDMLAWLHDRGFATRNQTYRTEGDRETMCFVGNYGADPDDDLAFTAPTLHAALEQAVLAVGGAE